MTFEKDVPRYQTQVLINALTGQVKFYFTSPIWMAPRGRSLPNVYPFDLNGWPRRDAAKAGTLSASPSSSGSEGFRSVTPTARSLNRAERVALFRTGLLSTDCLDHFQDRLHNQVRLIGHHFVRTAHRHDEFTVRIS
jgi:hypothetical protein